MDQPGKVANPACRQRPENLVSRDRFNRPVPRQYAHSPYLGGIWCLLITGFLPVSAAASIYCLNHCGKSAGTGPVVLKLVPVKGAAFTSQRTINVRLSFPTPIKGMRWAC